MKPPFSPAGAVYSGEASVRICFSAKAMYRSPSAAGTKPLSSTSAEAMIAAADASRGVEARAGALETQ